MLIRDYYRLQLHAVELQTAIRTTAGFLGSARLHRLASLCTGHCRVCVAQDIKSMRPDVIPSFLPLARAVSHECPTQGLSVNTLYAGNMG